MGLLLVRRAGPSRLSRLFMLWVACALGGCSQSGQGYLFTQNSQPLRLSENLLLTQGHKRFEFSRNPWWMGRLRLQDEQSDFSTWVSSSRYAGNSFSIDSRDSGLAYDIRARWQEEGEGLQLRDGVEQCTGAGHCTKQVGNKDCGQKTDREGSERLEEEDCKETVRTESGYFPDCPGERSVRRRYKVYNLLVAIEFHRPSSTAWPVAEFQGETGSRERLLETLDNGPCQVH